MANVTTDILITTWSGPGSTGTHIGRAGVGAPGAGGGGGTCVVY